jgi:hypothetical protein
VEHPKGGIGFEEAQEIFWHPTICMSVPMSAGNFVRSDELDSNGTP